MSAVAPQARSPIWTFYAFGGGLGHLTRALSLARQAARRGGCCRVLSNSPFLPVLSRGRVQTLIPPERSIELVEISSALDRAALTAISLQEIARCRPEDVLVIDTFPRGIGGELEAALPEIPAFKVFVHRDLNPEYVRRANLANSLRHYDLVLAPGDDAPLEHLAHARTPPWMICDADELLPYDEARRAFGVEGEKPLIVVTGSGNVTEALAAARMAGRLDQELAGGANVRFASLDEAALAAAGPLGRSLWPLMAALPGVDLLIGAGGYNTVYEARQTGTPFVAIPRRRLYDRQARRLLPHERITGFEPLLARAKQLPASLSPCWKRDCAVHTNGAAVPYALIAARLAGPYHELAGGQREA